MDRSSCAALVVLLALALVAAENRLLSQLDNVDVDAVLGDPARLDTVLSCFRSDKDNDCNVQSKAFKSLIAEMVKTNCGECSDGQKAGVAKFFTFVSKNKPEEMKQLLAKYDPNGEALAKYGDSWRQKGITV